MELKINSGSFGRMFGVPNDVTDKYIKLANENQLKVLLILLRYNSQKITSEQIASFLNISEKDVENAIDFWKKTSIFDSSNNNLPIQEKKVVKEEKKSDSSAERGSALSPSAISKMEKESTELSNLFSMTEKIINRQLTNADRNCIVYIYNDLNLNASVIATLVKYCESINKSNFKYVSQIAIDWKNKGIDSLEKACVEINKMTDSREFNQKIYKIFKLKNPLTTAQLEFVEKWRQKGYSDEKLKAAYENAIERINQANFKYIDTTLLNWEKDGENPYSNNSVNELDKYMGLANNFEDF